MTTSIKTLLRRWVHRNLFWIIVPTWRVLGRKVPTPHALKQRLIRECAVQFGALRLVETGTYRGDMVDAMRDFFDEVHSVEVFEPLFVAAVNQFQYFENVHIHLGNSAEVFVELLPTLRGTTVFWLDGHYSGEGTGGNVAEVPVIGELEQIGYLPGIHVILIDDARLFNGMNGYPTIDRIREWATSNCYDKVYVADDIIRVTCSTAVLPAGSVVPR